jgi:hypothetical protein
MGQLLALAHKLLAHLWKQNIGEALLFELYSVCAAVVLQRMQNKDDALMLQLLAIAHLQYAVQGETRVHPVRHKLRA